MEGMEFKTLLRDSFGAVVHTDHPLASTDDPLSWSELKNYKFISMGADTGFKALLEKVLPETANFAAAQIEGSNIATIIALLKAGLGVAALPKLVMRTENTGLVYRKLIDPPLFRELGLVTRSGRGLSPSAKSFAANIVDTLNELEASD
jgi:LysR family carnitine catabolism transcriptional activator